MAAASTQCSDAATAANRRRPRRSASGPIKSASRTPNRTTASPTPSAASLAWYALPAYGSVWVSRPPVPPA